MATVTETAIKVNAEQAETTLKSLREDAKKYRKEMEEAGIASDKFNDAQKNLNNTLGKIKEVLSLGKEEIQWMKKVFTHGKLDLA